MNRKYEFKNTTEDFQEKYFKGKLNDYERKALEFLRDNKVDLLIIFSHKGKHFSDDKKERNIYKVTIRTEREHGYGHTFKFDFGDSIHNTEQYEANRHKPREQRKYVPTAYSILACLNISYCDTYQEFCDEFGYEACDPENFDGNFINESTMKIFRAVQNETENLKQLFTEEQLEALHEIQ